MSSALSQSSAESVRFSLVGGLLGSHPLVRRAVIRWVLIAQSYAVGLALLFVTVQQGLAPFGASLLLTLYCAVGMAAFYVVLRSGRAAQSRDPMLTFPLALFGASAIALSYGVCELSRAASLQLLFLLVVFDMQRLNQRQTTIITLGATGILIALLAYMAVRAEPGFELRREVFGIGMAAFMLPMLSLVAREIRSLRRKQISQRTELEATLQRLNDLSRCDALTGLFNRRHMLSLLEGEAKRQNRSGHQFCVAMLDLDWFKRINDTFGHQVGDAVLRDFGKIATSLLRTSDAVGRWGGEEFVLMLYDVDRDASKLALERLRQAVAQHDWSAIAPGLKVSFSAGICAHAPGGEIRQTLERADHALYAAKAAGRDCAVVAQDVASS
jgi:diguanylate cyclase (GGDEF)-like protein